MNLIEIAKKHRAAEMLIAGEYGFEGSKWRGKGCSVGCFAYDLGFKDECDIHEFVSEKTGIPEWAVHLQDRIFEGLHGSPDWHVDFATAASEVSNWQDALHNVHCAILDVALEHAGPAKPQVQAVRDLHAAKSDDDAAWNAARNAAWSAAWNAAWNAARNAAWSAAWSAAWNAAESAARNAAWNAAYKSMSASILAAMRAS